MLSQAFFSFCMAGDYDRRDMGWGCRTLCSMSHGQQPCGVWDKSTCSPMSCSLTLTNRVTECSLVLICKQRERGMLAEGTLKRWAVSYYKRFTFSSLWRTGLLGDTQGLGSHFLTIHPQRRINSHMAVKGRIWWLAFQKCFCSSRPRQRKELTAWSMSLWDHRETHILCGLILALEAPVRERNTNPAKRTHLDCKTDEMLWCCGEGTVWGIFIPHTDTGQTDTDTDWVKQKLCN